MLVYENPIAVRAFIIIVKVQNILLTKTAAAQSEIALTYHSVRGLYFRTVIFRDDYSSKYICSLYSSAIPTQIGEMCASC